VTIFAPLVRNVRNGLHDPQTPISSPDVLKLFDGESSTAGPRVDEKKSLTIASVWRAVNLIAGTIASLPLHGYKPDVEVDARTQIKTGKAATLLAAPHPFLTRYEWVELIVGHILLWGNAYCLVHWDNFGRAWLLPLHPSTVTPKVERRTLKTYKVEGIKHTLTDATLKPEIKTQIVTLQPYLVTACAAGASFADLHDLADNGLPLALNVVDALPLSETQRNTAVLAIAVAQAAISAAR